MSTPIPNPAHVAPPVEYGKVTIYTRGALGNIVKTECRSIRTKFRKYAQYENALEVLGTGGKVRKVVGATGGHCRIAEHGPAVSPGYDFFIHYTLPVYPGA